MEWVTDIGLDRGGIGGGDESGFWGEGGERGERGKGREERGGGRIEMKNCL